MPFTIALRGLKRVKYNQNAVHDVCGWQNLTWIWVEWQYVYLMTNYRIQILKHLQILTTYLTSTAPSPVIKTEEKNRALQWKHSIHIRTGVVVSKALIRLRNLLLPRHQFTHMEQKPVSVCQRMTKLATEGVCMGFHLTGRDQLCSEWRSWCKCVTWMGWQQSGFGVHQVLSTLIILCCLVPACFCSQKVTLTQFVLQQTKLKPADN